MSTEYVYSGRHCYSRNIFFCFIVRDSMRRRVMPHRGWGTSGHFTPRIPLHSSLKVAIGCLNALARDKLRSTGLLGTTSTQIRAHRGCWRSFDAFMSQCFREPNPLPPLYRGVTQAANFTNSSKAMHTLCGRHSRSSVPPDSRMLNVISMCGRSVYRHQQYVSTDEIVTLSRSFFFFDFTVGRCR